LTLKLLNICSSTMAINNITTYANSWPFICIHWPLGMTQTISIPHLIIFYPWGSGKYIASSKIFFQKGRVHSSLHCASDPSFPSFLPSFLLFFPFLLRPPTPHPGISSTQRSMKSWLRKTILETKGNYLCTYVLLMHRDLSHIKYDYNGIN
jgi:hypothetical protein